MYLLLIFFIFLGCFNLFILELMKMVLLLLYLVVVCFDYCDNMFWIGLMVSVRKYLCILKIIVRF